MIEDLFSVKILFLAKIGLRRWAKYRDNVRFSKARPNQVIKIKMLATNDTRLKKMWEKIEQGGGEKK